MNTIKQNNLVHLRSLIRKSIRDILIDSVDVGKRVFLSRPNAIWLEEVPCCLVYFDDEISETKNTKPKKYWNTLSIGIQIISNFSKDIDDWLDSRALEVQYAIETNRYLGLSFVNRIDLFRTKPYSIESDAASDFQSVVMTYSVEYKDDLEYTELTPDEFLRFYGNIDNKIESENQIREK